MGKPGTRRRRDWGLFSVRIEASFIMHPLSHALMAALKEIAPFKKAYGVLGPTHRLLSSSLFVVHIYIESYRVIPKRSYLGAYE